MKIKVRFSHFYFAFHSACTIFVNVNNSTAMETTDISLNKHIVDDARIYAERQGTSLSELIENYLTRLVRKEKRTDGEVPDIVMSLLGAGEPVDDDDINGRKAYREYLKEKYG